MSSSELNSAFELAPSGTLSGNSNATFAGTFTWSGGYMRGGTGKVILTNGSVLAITSGNNKFFDHSVDLYTTNASWNNGLLYSGGRSEVHTTELQSHSELVCRTLLYKKKGNYL